MCPILNCITRISFSLATISISFVVQALERRFTRIQRSIQILRQSSLIAILLSCFRTTVANCRKEYEDLSHKIFGKPRWLSQRTAIIVPWPKYSAKKMEKVLKDVTHRSCEDSAWRNNVYTPPSFPTIQDTCATYVHSASLAPQPYWFSMMDS